MRSSRRLTWLHFFWLWAFFQEVSCRRSAQKWSFQEKARFLLEAFAVETHKNGVFRRSLTTTKTTYEIAPFQFSFLRHTAYFNIMHLNLAVNNKLLVVSTDKVVEILAIVQEDSHNDLFIRQARRNKSQSVSIPCGHKGGQTCSAVKSYLWFATLTLIIPIK